MGICGMHRMTNCTVLSTCKKKHYIHSVLVAIHPYTMPRDEVDVSAEPRKRTLSAYICNQDNISRDRDQYVKRIKQTVIPGVFSNNCYVLPWFYIQRFGKPLERDSESVNHHCQSPGPTTKKYKPKTWTFIIKKLLKSSRQHFISRRWCPNHSFESSHSATKERPKTDSWIIWKRRWRRSSSKFCSATKESLSQLRRHHSKE